MVDILVDEVVVAAVRAAEQHGNNPSDQQAWATLEGIVTQLKGAPTNIRERLMQLAANGILQMTFRWRNHAPEDIQGVHPSVGYSKDHPIFRVLESG
jgi:hypothetical protein